MSINTDAQVSPETRIRDEPEAFPIEPPSDSENECNSAPLAMLSASDLAALADDVPSRLRTNVLQGHVEALWHDATSIEPPRKAMRLDSDHIPRSSPPSVPETPLEPFATSDSFALGGDDWDLDDSQLYSDEMPLLSVPSNTSENANKTGALNRFLSQALEHDEKDAAGGPLVRTRDDLVLSPESLSELLMLLRRDANLVCGARVPLLDVDPGKLSRLLGLLERTMQVQLAEAEAPPTSQTSDSDVERIAALSASLVAAQCTLTILLVDQLPKYMLAEELVELCISTVIASMNTLVLPLVEACNGGESPPYISSVSTALSRGVSAQLDSALTSHFEHFSATLLQVEGLFRLTGVRIADALLIRSVFLALSPFFAQGDTPRTKQRASRSVTLYVHATALRPVRISALEILRSIFAHYPAQRHWVLGEILVSLLRLPDLRHKRRQFRLANGRTIFVISALLLQLIQAAAYTPPSMHTQTLSWLEDGEGKPPTSSLFQEVQSLASTIAVYLMQRSSEAKLVKSTHDLSYASVVYYLMEDLVALLADPAWPAAPLLLSCFCRVMISAVNDPKSSVGAKSIALDHLGIVAARLRRMGLDVSAASNTRHSKGTSIKSLAEIAKARDIDALTELTDACCSVLSSLRDSSDKQAGASALSMFSLGFAYEMALCMEYCRREPDRSFELALFRAYHRVVTLEGNYGAPSTTVALQLILLSPFVVRYESLVAPLIQSLGSATLATRARSLRALGNFAAVDSSVLQDAGVRQTVATRLVDSSAQVRETAVAIFSSYLLCHQDALAEQGAAVAARAADAAPAVRRRALHFLHGMYLVGNIEAKVHATVRILRCFYDIDVGVQTFARQILQQLWFPDDHNIETPIDAPQPPLAEVAAVLVSTSSRISERPSPLTELLKAIRNNCTKNFDERLGSLVDALIGSLFSGESLSTNALLDRIRAVHMLVSVSPTVLTIARAKQLLPYIAGGADPDEAALFEEFLRVFRVSLPHLPRTARSLGESLEKVLVPLVSRCTFSPESTVLQELVACLCTVVHFQTQNTLVLKSIADACVARLEALTEDSSRCPNINRAAFLTMTISALVCEHGKLELLDRGHLVDKVSSCLTKLRDAPTGTFRVPAIIAMGYILRAHPSRFVDISDSLIEMLASGPVTERTAVLHVLLDTLNSEAAANGQLAAPFDVMGELTGTAEELADTSVASALMQQFATQILESTLDVHNTSLQATAMEILSTAVLQGLCHPLQCVPYLVALETAPDVLLRSRALRLHMHLASRHAALLATRFGDGVRKSFEFQSALGACPLGFVSDPRPTARLAIWYELVREKRHTRTEFLRALLRMLGGAEPCSESDLCLAIYIAENLATFDYRIVDEMLVIINELRIIHAGAGQQFAAIARRVLGSHERDRELSPLTDEESQASDGNDSSHLSDDTEERDPTAVLSSESRASHPMLALARRALIFQAILRLERHLKQLYRLSEKCVLILT